MTNSRRSMVKDTFNDKQSQIDGKAGGSARGEGGAGVRALLLTDTAYSPTGSSGRMHTTWLADTSRASMVRAGAAPEAPATRHASPAPSAKKVPNTATAVPPNCGEGGADTCQSPRCAAAAREARAAQAAQVARAA